MQTIGVDLAASPRNTAAVAVGWRDGRACVDGVWQRCADEELLTLLARGAEAGRVGVDCPFGWPIAFVHAVMAHRRGAVWPGRKQDADEFRRSLWYRRTDLRVREATGRSPMSVSFDRLGAVTARWAHLADALARRGIEVDRTGLGSFVEVYPAASRRRWSVDGDRSVATLQVAAPWLELAAGVERELDTNEHAYDALIAALAARAAALGLTDRPDDGDLDAARVEGWIHLPADGSLARLPAPRS